VCLLAALCEGYDLQSAAVCASGISADFGPTPNELGTLFSANTLGSMVGALLGGRLADSAGRRPVLIAALLLFGIGSLASAASWDMPALTWTRLLTGVGIGAALPTAFTLTNEHSRADRRRSAVALVYAAIPFGAGIVSLASMLTPPAHWRYLFVAGGLMPVAVALAAMSGLEESPAFTAARRLPAAPAPGAIGSLRGLLGNGRALTTLLLWPSFFFGWLTLYILLSWLPTLLVGAGFTPARAAATQAAFNTGGGLMALLTAHSLEGRYRNALMVTVFACVPLCVLLLRATPLELNLIVPVVFALGCAVVVALGFLYSLAPTCYPAAIRGVGVGAAVAMGRLGAVVGPKLGGVLRSQGHALPRVLLDILPLVLLGSVAALLLVWQAARAPAVEADR